MEPVSFNLGWGFIALIGLWGFWKVQQHYIGLTFFRSKMLVQIVYKSGYIDTRWYYKFSIDYRAGDLTGAEWNPADPSQTLWMGVDEIESIRRIDVRSSIWRWFGKEV